MKIFLHMDVINVTSSLYIGVVWLSCQIPIPKGSELNGMRGWSFEEE